ncbi:ABC transporter family substrate-binding protein [Mycobacterium manitobense]|uniref:Probable monoacyl phosphatidylinositol tetramannoside-binding protein LpqW n=2 Tax=Mycolicibacterium TaxID=1866885 RepID=A0A9X3BW66_9MYCO|nr:ABC transporter family substrate-binding protein [[Mycobacterium] manitobense]MCV7172473.1 ABC transporter family substrate-binding protein [[Mycobacterium] manitobense]
MITLGKPLICSRAAARRTADTLRGVPNRTRQSCARLGALVSVPALLLGGCTVSPPPAPQSTETTESVTPPPPKATQIIMAIDSIGPGFNPHLLSDQSPVNAAIAALVLPSSFRPVPDPASPTGSRWELDTALLESAEVTNRNPFTVTYTIKPEAQWTDNAPVAADDYWYLWQQMVSQPGVVDPAGYDLITGVQSVEGGKQAVVTFSQPYPAWRELFNNILPAHIVKDVPGGFGAGLARAMPVTAGKFRVDDIDPQRDEILLARNDRFWSGPAKPDQVLFRRGGSPAALADSIRNGDTQVAQIHGGAATFAQLSAIPDVRTARIVTPRVMQVTLRAGQPKLAEAQVRKAVLGLFDVDLLASVGAGDDNTVTLAQAQVRTPSDPGYVPTAPPALGTEAALGLLADAGYEVAPVENPPPPTPGTPAPDNDRGRITKDGVPLSLVLGVAVNDPTSVAVANTAADQLRNVGIEASVLALDPVTLYGEALANNRVDAVVGWHAAGGDLATSLASRYGCRALEATPVPTAAPTSAPPPRTDAPPPPPPPSATATPSAPPPDPETGELVQAPSNITGICDRSLQPKIDAALDGTEPIAEVIEAVEPRLWNMSTVLPILQDTTIVAAGPSVQNVSLSGAVPVGIVGDAGNWTKNR